MQRLVAAFLLAIAVHFVSAQSATAASPWQDNGYPARVYHAPRCYRYASRPLVPGYEYQLRRGTANSAAAYTAMFSF